MRSSPSTPKETLQSLLEETLKALFPSQTFRVTLEVPKDRRHGDWTTHVAMRVARLEKQSSLEVARKIHSHVERGLKEKDLDALFQKIEVSPPGFINFFLKETLHRHVLSVIASRPDYGASSLGQGTHIHIEFVSANPTGPLSVAHGRQAALGDSLARILQFCGYHVSREYYVNDVGNQIRLLGKSLHVRYLELLGEKGEIPEEGYHGQYLVAIAKAIHAQHGDRYRDRTEEHLRFFEKVAVQRILEEIQEDLEHFRVSFDHFTPESTLHAGGKVKETLELLRKKEVLFESEGATWFRSTRFGDDKDRVVVKSDGSFTYLAPDLAYHREKLKRGFNRMVNLWGPDHHGYIGRLKAGIQALGYPQEVLSIVLVQLATLTRGGEAVPMSTRMGEFVTLREVMEEVGVDAARFFFVMKKCSSHLDFDLSLAKQQSLENPVYTIQYAHARVSNILKFGEGKVEAAPPESVACERLRNEEELETLKVLGEFESALLSSARQLEPVYLVLYLQRLAGAFHRFYQKHRVITEDIPLTEARLLLALCVQKIIHRGLTLLGISAPDKM